MTDAGSRKVTEDPNSVEAMAAYWLARLRSDRASTSDQRRFRNWLAESPAHMQAYALQEEVWANMQDASVDDDILAMRQSALARPAAANHGTWQKMGALAAAIVLFVVSATIFLPTLFAEQENGIAPTEQLASSPAKPTVYKTAVGQRSTVNLPDGSVVELNTNSLVQLNFNGQRRDVILLRGEALFDVAKDASRPFVVEVDGKLVTAIGTMFSVRRDDNEVRVTLIEGVVTVDHENSEDPAARGPKRLSPGEQLVSGGDGAFQISSINTAAVTSWRNGQLVFDNESLGTIVGEVNRYTSRKLVLGDDTLKELKVSGVFQVGSVDAFAAALEVSFPVTSSTAQNGEIVVLDWTD